jgi:1-acyl-sn-glycerol-3-phosphate acyltransferase
MEKLKLHTGYSNILAKNDTYKTPEEVKKNSFLPLSFRFYPKLVKLFLYANKLTKSNEYDRYNWVATSKAILDILEEVGIKFEITGMKNLTSFEGPAIFIGNHMSTLETVILPYIINPVKPVVFVTKEELNSTPVFGPINAARHPILVGRNNARADLMKVMEQGAERIKNGRSIIIFPQRTRSPKFDARSFNSLGIKLARKNNVPVVPVALLTDAWGNGKIIKDFGKIDSNKIVHFAFGRPIKVTGNGSEQHEKVIEFIISKLKEWGREDLTP